MITKNGFYDLDNWTRVGRGKELQFFATDMEIKEWFQNDLPKEYAPYCFVTSERIQKGDEYVELPVVREIDTFPASLLGTDGQRVDLWLWSKKLWPDILSRLTSGVSRCYSINGLIILQHQLVYKGKVEASRIAFVDRIKDRATDEIHTHKEYAIIFKALSRVIDRLLVYSSIRVFPSGEEFEDTSLQRMTRGAVEAYNSGVPYFNRPGKLLERQKPYSK